MIFVERVKGPLGKYTRLLIAAMVKLSFQSSTAVRIPAYQPALAGPLFDEAIRP